MPTAPAKKSVVYTGWAHKRELTADDAKKLGITSEFRKTTFNKNEPHEVDSDVAEVLAKSKDFKIVEA